MSSKGILFVSGNGFCPKFFAERANYFYYHPAIKHHLTLKPDILVRPKGFVFQVSRPCLVFFVCFLFVFVFTHDPNFFVKDLGDIFPIILNKKTKTVLPAVTIMILYIT